MGTGARECNESSMIYDFRVLGTGTPDGTEHLANDKLSFRFIEIMYGNFEVELEKNDE